MSLVSTNKLIWISLVWDGYFEKLNITQDKSEYKDCYNTFYKLVYEVSLDHDKKI